MAYYENPGMLQAHYDSWRAMPGKLREHLHVVVVDDGSPKNIALPPKGLDVAVQIYRMDKDVRWNQDACRNIGVHHAETNWVLLTDIDHMLPAHAVKTLCSNEWDTGKVYRFRRVSAPDNEEYKPHPNSWFMTRKMFDAIGGYDERFAGLYGTDGDFRDRVLQHAEVVFLKEHLIRVPRQVIPDASTTTYLRKQPEDREGLARVRMRRDAEGVWTPKRLTFPYHRVFP